MGKVISILGTSSKISNSVLTVNLALALQGFSKKNIVILDLNKRDISQIEFLLNYKPEKKLGDIIEILDKADSSLIKGFVSKQEQTGLSLITPEKDLNFQDISPKKIEILLKLLVDTFDGIVVNSPEENTEWLEVIISQTDNIVSTIDQNLLALNKARDYFDLFKSWHIPLNIVELLLINSSKKGLIKDEIKEYLGVDITLNIPYTELLIESSINDGIPFIVSSPHKAISGQIKKLARKVWQKDTAKDRKKQKVENNQQVASKNVGDEEYDIDYINLRNKIHELLLIELREKDINLKTLSDISQIEQVRETVRVTIQDLIAYEGASLTREQRIQFVEDLLNEVLGLGPLEELLSNPEITEVMVNGYDRIYIEKKGKIELSDITFSSEEQLYTAIDRIVAPIGRRVDESVPLVDARLIDGSRVNIIIPPLALKGPTITIRKFSDKKLIVDDLIKFGALTKEMGEFLEICVKIRKNIVVSGGTGSGKTTLLNVISSFIPIDERVVTIEDSAELKLPQDHVVSLESRPASLEGTGAIPIRRLVINSLRMRPDRIVVGECRGSETLDMLQAMNTGHDGSLTTLHANTPKDAISRISTMVIMAGTELPEKAIKEQIGSAVQIIIQLSRLSDGSRKVTEIAEINGLENDNINIIPLFKFRQDKIDEGKVVGKFVATGNKPTFFDEIKVQGLEIDEKMFNKS